MKGRSQSSSIRKRRSRRSNLTASKSARTRRCAEVLRKLEDLANPEARMAYLRVQVPMANGVSAPVLHKLAREIGKDHRLARC